MAFGRGKDTLPFQLALQEENKSPKKGSEFRAGNPPHLLLRSPELSPSHLPQAITSPKATRNFQIFQSPALHQSSPSVHFKPAPLPPASPDSSHSHETPSNLDQPKHTPRLLKQRHRPATQGGSSPPTPVPAHFLPGRVGGGRDPLLSGQAHPHSPGAAGRSLTHPEDSAARGRSPRAGGGPLSAEGARVPEKPAAATGMPGPESAPPSPRAPLVPGPSPAPWARPGSSSQFGLPGPARLRLPLHVRRGCAPGSPLSPPCRPRLLRGPSPRCQQAPELG